MEPLAAAGHSAAAIAQTVRTSIDFEEWHRQGVDLAAAMLLVALGQTTQSAPAH